MLPLFPELRRFFDEAFAMAGEGECWVVPMRAGKTKKNLGTTFKKIRRSSVEPGSRIGQSLFRTYDPVGRLSSSRRTPLTWFANGYIKNITEIILHT